MAEITVRKMAADIPIYCAACNINHAIPYSDIEVLIYALQASLLDTAMDAAIEDGSLACLLTSLNEADDVEMYYEYTLSMVISRLNVQGIRCDNHSFWSGPHHDKKCPLYAEEEQ